MKSAVQIKFTYLLTYLLMFCLVYRRSLSEAKTKKILPATRKDQTTSTCDNEVYEVSSLNSCHLQDGLNQSLTEKGDNRHNASVISMQNGNIIANPDAVAIRVECADLELNADLNDLMCLREATDQTRGPSSLTDSLFFYNQPVAILHAPAFFHLEEQAEQPQWSKSASVSDCNGCHGEC